MRGLRTVCLLATLVMAQFALARADGGAAPAVAALSCETVDLGPDVQCARPSDTADPAGGVAIRKQPGKALSRNASLTALQMNLCNSGIAGCFTGRAAARAAQITLDRAPALVTVNEACETDVTDRLLPAMLTHYPNEWLFWTFAPAAHRGSGEPVRCTPDPQGRPRGRFGNGALGRLFTDTRPRFAFEGGLFPDELQDRAHGELRSWVCAEVNLLYQACTTHLDNPSATGEGTPEAGRVAFGQCRAFATRRTGRSLLLGDLNLSADPAARYNVRDCTPQGWSHHGDGAVQHVLAGNDFGPATVEVLEMSGATDHPALLIVFPQRPGGHP
jgi:hypothetical protein